VEVRGHLDLLLLATLERLGRAHGYALIAALRGGSGGAFDLAEGTVYPALHRLERGGAVRSELAEVAARQRREYRLTGAGAAMLADRRRQWHAFANAMTQVVGADRAVPSAPCEPSPPPPSRSPRCPGR
jgi:PadR family transcriptional regulator